MIASEKCTIISVQIIICKFQQITLTTANAFAGFSST